MGIKITPADKAFSLCIRERSNWTCDRCDTFYPEGKRMALHCSHYHGRGKYSTRFDPNNCWAHCFGCHRYLSAHPAEFTAWALEKLGDGLFEIVCERAQDMKLGRLAKREAKEIAKYYRDQHKNMRTQREIGIEGRIEIVGYF